MKLFAVVVLCLVGAGAVVMAGKYSQQMNEPKLTGGDGKALEFRIAKLGQVWDKANRVRVSILSLYLYLSIYIL